MSITSLDGTVTQIFASNPPNALTRNGNGNYATSDENFMVNGETVGVGGLMAQGAIHFFLNDHLGSSALEFAAGGFVAVHAFWRGDQSAADGHAGHR